jgi:hypothetical protein
MRGEAIFGPMAVIALWTMAVLFLTALRRIRGTLQGQIPRGAFKLGESPDVPPDVTVLNRNFMNLLELPVLFYVVCLVLYVTARVSPALVGLAWLYAVLRLVHSFIHLTSNRVIARLVSFSASFVVLFAMWIWLLVELV